MTAIELLKLDLYRLCRYDISEPNHEKYNRLIHDTINKMPLQSVLFALEDLNNVNS
jgi:hypothetical protein